MLPIVTVRRELAESVLLPAGRFGSVARDELSNLKLPLAQAFVGMHAWSFESA